MTNVAIARAVAYTACVEYVRELRLLEHPESVISGPTARYIMDLHRSVPLKALFVAERPYATRIHPYVFSAMSYDPNRSEPTPSTLGMANDLSVVCGMNPVTVEQWFRDSWKYADCGIVLLNICCYSKFTDVASLRERTAFKNFVLEMVRASSMCTGDRIKIFAMGNPAQSEVSSLMSGMTTERAFVKNYKFKNPASFAHVKGDSTSQVSTFGHPGASKEICKIIQYTTAREQHTVLHFTAMSTPAQSEVDAFTSGCRDGLKSLKAAMEFYQKPGAHDDAQGVEGVMIEFVKVLENFTSAMNGKYVQAVVRSLDEPMNAAKPATWGERTKWKPASVIGSESQQSVLRQLPAPVPVIFAEDMEGDSTSKLPAVPAVGPVDKGKAKSIPHRPLAEMKFAEDDESPPPSPGKSKPTTEGLIAEQAAAPTKGELKDLRAVSSFIGDGEDLVLPEKFCSDLSDSVLNGRVSNKTTDAVLAAIRRTNAEGKMSVTTCLGFEDGIIDVGSPIYQYLSSVPSA